MEAREWESEVLRGFKQGIAIQTAAGYDGSV